MKKYYQKSSLGTLGFLIVVLMLPVLLLTFSGCTAKQVEKTKLKVAYLPYTPFATFFIAQEEGYFAEQGLEVEFVKFSTMTNAIPLLIQGDLDVTAGPVSASFINAVASSANLKIVAGREYVGPDGLNIMLTVNKELFESGQVDEIAELKGKKIAVPTIGSLMDYALALILSQADLTLKDVELVKLTPQDSVAAIGNKAVAAGVLGQLESVQVVSMGFGVNLKVPGNILSGFQQGFVFFGPNLLEGKSDVGKNFLKAYIKGCKKYNEGKTERNLEIIQKYLEVDKDTVMKANLSPVYDDGRIIVDDVMSFQEWLYTLNLINTKPSSAEMIVDTLLKSALQDKAR